jgi:chorismate lyase
MCRTFIAVIRWLWSQLLNSRDIFGATLFVLDRGKPLMLIYEVFSPYLTKYLGPMQLDVD